jgi:hypothetical protein
MNKTDQLITDLINKKISLGLVNKNNATILMLASK